jgi:hypothetical protein
MRRTLLLLSFIVTTARPLPRHNLLLSIKTLYGVYSKPGVVQAAKGIAECIPFRAAFHPGQLAKLSGTGQTGNQSSRYFFGPDTPLPPIYDKELAEHDPQRADRPSRSDEMRRVIQEYIDDQREVLRKLRRMLS